VEILNGCPNCGWNKFLFVHDESQAVPESTTEGEKEQPAKKFLKEIDEFLADQGVKVDEVKKMEQEPEGERIESIRIMGPGSYELNLEALLERKEIIMALHFHALKNVFGVAETS